jgi:hypothetical protein
MKNRTTIISVLLIPADLTKPCTMVNIRKGDYALKDMYKHMDCDYVQRLHVQRLETPKKNMILWVDEEGRLLLALEGKRNPKTNVRGSLLAKEQIFGNVILAGQDSLYDVDGIEFDTIKGLVKKLEDTAQMVIAKHPQMNQ